MPLKFTTKEKRDELAKRLAALAMYMERSRDQGGSHSIIVTDEMMEDIKTAACVVGLSEIVPEPVAFPQCEYCEKQHDPRVACPAYVAHRKPIRTGIDWGKP